MDDEDDVAELLARPQPSSFGMAGWTHERELLTTLVDAVSAMHATLIAVNSDDKPPAVSELPRPVTAIERVERRVAREQREAMVAQLLPSGPGPAEVEVEVVERHAAPPAAPDGEGSVPEWFDPFSI